MLLLVFAFWVLRKWGRRAPNPKVCHRSSETRMKLFGNFDEFADAEALKLVRRIGGRGSEIGIVITSPRERNNALCHRGDHLPRRLGSPIFSNIFGSFFCVNMLIYISLFFAFFL